MNGPRDDSEVLRAAFHSLGQAIVVADADQRLVFVNAAFIRLFDLPADRVVVGAPLSGLLSRMSAHCEKDGQPADGMDRLADRLASLTEPQTFTQCWTDGTIVEGQCLPVAGGGCIIVCTEATDRRRKELALLRAEQRLHAILTHAAALIYLKDPSGRYVLVNRRFEDMVGADSGRIVGNTNHDLFDTATALRMQVSDRLALDTGQPIDFEETLPSSRGERVFKTVKVPVVGAQGVIEGLCCISTDITEHKRAEERLRVALAEQNAVFDHASFGIVIVRKRRIQQINRAAEDMFGYAHGTLAQAPTLIFYPGEDAHDLVTRESNTVLRRGQTYRTERQLRRKDGSVFWGYLVGSPIDPTDPARGSIWLLEDMTDRKRSRDTLLAAMKAAEGANIAKSRFLANMSHELRTPLNAIIGFSDMIQSEIFGPVGTPQYATYATDIHRSGLHLLTLVNDILDLSKIEAGRFDLREEWMDVGAALEECVTMTRVRADEGQVTLIADMAPHLPRLFADRTAVAQVMLNLLSNAVKFTDPGGRITLSAGLAGGGLPDGEDGGGVPNGDDGGGSLVVTVSDTGIGIPPEAIETVFEPFAQAKADVSRSRAGTGLGLPIARRLMTMHGGTLTIASRVDHGTTVTAVFPKSRLMSADGTVTP